MAQTTQPSAKHLEINKANRRLVVVIAVAAAVTAVSIVASRAILIKRAYQGRVIAEKEVAARQLEANIKAVNSLVSAYQAFIDQPENIIGGSSIGTGPRDGDNARIVLDALPSSYDFPALASSLESILKERQYSDTSITGVDEEIAQKEEATKSTTPIAMPFQLNVTGNYTSIQELISVLDRSIRPIQIKKLTMAGNDQDMQISVDAQTYYLPEKKLSITKKVVQ